MLSIGILALFLLAYWLFAIRIFPSALAPASMWLMGWTILFSVCAFLGWGYTYKWQGVALLMVGVMIFPIGCLFATKPKSKPISPALKRRWLVELEWLIKLSPVIQVSTAAVGVVGAIALSHHFGRSILSLSSFAELALAAQANGARIESGEEVMPLFSSIAFGILQIGFIASGILVARRGIWFKPGMLLGILLAVVVMWTLVTTIRSYFVASVVWFVGSFVATKICLGKERGFVKPRIIILSIVAFVTLSGLAIISQSFRMGDYHFELVGAAAAHMRPWAASFVSGFSCWYDELLRNPDAGAATGVLQGILAALGIVKHAAFDRSETMIQIGGGATTNAITIFKAVITEWGTLGGMVFTFAAGYLSQVVYDNCRRGSLMGLASYSVATAAILWAPDAWFFKYGSRVAAALLFFCLILGGRILIDLVTVPKRPDSLKAVLAE